MERFPVDHGEDVQSTASFRKFTTSFPNLTAAFCELTAAFLRIDRRVFPLERLTIRPFCVILQKYSVSLPKSQPPQGCLPEEFIA